MPVHGAASAEEEDNGGHGRQPECTLERWDQLLKPERATYIASVSRQRHALAFSRHDVISFFVAQPV